MGVILDLPLKIKYKTTDRKNYEPDRIGADGRVEATEDLKWVKTHMLPWCFDFQRKREPLTAEQRIFKGLREQKASEGPWGASLVRRQ